MSSSSILRHAMRSTEGDSATRLAAAEELHESLLMSQTESSGQFTSIVPIILQSISHCTLHSQPNQNHHNNDLDSQIIAKCFDSLLVTLDGDSSVRRTLAVPTSLRILRYASTLLTDEETISKYLKILHKITENHAQSILRSNILSSVNDWVDNGFIIGEDKRIYLDSWLRCVEASMNREDASLILDISPKFISLITQAFQYTCTRNSNSRNTITDSSVPSSSSSLPLRDNQWILTINKWPPGKSSVSIDNITMDYCCRIIARFLSIQSGIAKGHIAQWNWAYTAMENGEYQADSPIPMNWGLQAICHVVHMNILQGWVRALGGHCNIVCPGENLVFLSPSLLSTVGNNQVTTVSVESLPVSTRISGNGGFGLSRATVKAILRALTRTLIILKEASQRDEKIRRQLILRQQSQHVSMENLLVSSTKVSVPDYSEIINSLIESEGLLVIIQRLLTLFSGNNTNNIPSMVGTTTSIPTTSGTASSSLSPAALTSQPVLVDTTIQGIMRDGELLEDCLSLLSVLLPSSSATVTKNDDEVYTAVSTPKTD